MIKKQIWLRWWHKKMLPCINTIMAGGSSRTMLRAYIFIVQIHNWSTVALGPHVEKVFPIFGKALTYDMCHATTALVITLLLLQRFITSTTLYSTLPPPPLGFPHLLLLAIKSVPFRCLPSTTTLPMAMLILGDADDNNDCFTYQE